MYEWTVVFDIFMNQQTIKKPYIIILLGPPGSGKGTQAKILQKSFGFTHLSPGELLRTYEQSAKNISDNRKSELQKMHQGEMVSHELVYEIMFPLIEREVRQKHDIVIDGAIRSLEQVHGYMDFFQNLGVRENILAFWIEIAEQSAWDRIMLRKEKEKDTSGARHDDDDGVLKQRFSVQGATAQHPVIEALAHHVPLVMLDGLQSIETTSSEINGALRDYGVIM